MKLLFAVNKIRVKEWENLEEFHMPTQCYHSQWPQTVLVEPVTQHHPGEGARKWFVTMYLDEEQRTEYQHPWNHTFLSLFLCRLWLVLLYSSPSVWIPTLNNNLYVWFLNLHYQPIHFSALQIHLANLIHPLDTIKPLKCKVAVLEIIVTLLNHFFSLLKFPILLKDITIWLNWLQI